MLNHHFLLSLIRYVQKLFKLNLSQKITLSLVRSRKNFFIFSEDSNSNKLDRYRFNNHYWNARKNKFTDESFEELWPAN